MLNVFYWYSIIWGVVLFLYSLGFSTYNKPLDTNLLLFLVISILLSFTLGIINRKKFRYKGINIMYKRNRILTYISLIIGAMEFIFARNVPLFSIALGRSNYGDFQGIPLIHTILENFIIFYSSYLFYLFLESKDKSLLYESIALVSILLLMFHKGVVIFCLFIMLNLAVAKIRTKYKILSFKKLVLFAIFVVMILYVNGVLANIRSGYKWNDCSFILRIGGITYWPSFLPKELSWSYVYITSPLANLNLMVKEYADTFSFGQMFFTIVPIFLTKRMFPQFLINSEATYILNISALNACTGFAEPVVAASSIGLWFYYISYILIIMCTIKRIRKEKFATVFYAVMCMLITFLFFYNTLSTAATSFLIIYIWLYPLIKRIKIRRI